MRIARGSSLRKLMRAARRGKVPDDRLVVIDGAVFQAGLRRALYLNGCPARDAARRAA